METPTVRTVPRRARYLPWVAVAVVAVIAMVQWTAPWTDHQFSNIVSWILGLVAIALLVTWWALASADRPLRLWAPLGAAMLVVLGLVIVYEPVGVSGELVPRFRNRFAALPAPPAVEAHPLSAASTGGAVMTDGGFSGFLGPSRDGRIASRSFATDWAEDPPRRRWTQSVGEGLAGVAVVPVKLSATDAPTWVAITIEQRDKEEWVTCYDLRDGRLRWYHSAPGYHWHVLGDLGPRSTPTVDAEGRVFALGAAGLLRCLRGVDGELLWQVDLLELANIDQTTSERYVLWGRAASPLRVDDMVVLPLGGDPAAAKGTRTLVALDAATGAIRWTSGTHQISYASPVLTRLDGVRQIVSVDEDFASGCDPADGRVLWTTEWEGASNLAANCSNPVPFGDDQILLSKGYGGGAKMIQLVHGEEAWEVHKVWSERRVLKTKFTNVVVDGPYGYGISDGTLECVDLREGERQWRQPRGGRFGHGHVLIVEDVLLATTEEGEVVVAEANPAEYRELGRFQAVTGKTWNPPAVVDNTIIVRNGRELAVWDAPRRDQISASKDRSATGSRVANGSP